jgi:hypothetical protein
VGEYPERHHSGGHRGTDRTGSNELHTLDTGHAMIPDSFPVTIGGDKVLNEYRLLTGVEDGKFFRSVESVRYLVVHCSGTRCIRNYTVEQLLRDHKARGFRTVGYHFYIRRDGTVSQHRHLLEVGAHCRPYNHCSIGICYEGGLDNASRPADTRTAEQRASLLALLQKLRKLFPKATICGHRDMRGAVPKACPCFDARTEYMNL